MLRKWGSRGTAAVVAVVFVMGVNPAPASAAFAPAGEDRLFNLINAGRVQRNAEKLKWSKAIMREARKHSKYMASKGTISHDGLNARARRIRNNGGHTGSFCENVAWTQGYPLKRAMRIMYNGWVKSKVHFNCQFDRGGQTKKRVAAVGVFVAGNKIYSTFIAFQFE